MATDNTAPSRELRAAVSKASKTLATSYGRLKEHTYTLPLKLRFPHFAVMEFYPNPNGIHEFGLTCHVANEVFKTRSIIPHLGTADIEIEGIMIDHYKKLETQINDSCQEIKGHWFLKPEVQLKRLGRN